MARTSSNSPSGLQRGGAPKTAQDSSARQPGSKSTGPATKGGQMGAGKVTEVYDVVRHQKNGPSITGTQKGSGQ